MKLAVRCKEGGASQDTYSGERVWTTVLRHWGGQQKVERWERDQRPVGEGLSQEREARQGGRAEMWPRWQQATRGVGWTMWWPYAPTSTPSNDYYNDHDQADCWWDWRKIWKRGLAFDS